MITISPPFKKGLQFMKSCPGVTSSVTTGRGRGELSVQDSMGFKNGSTPSRMTILEMGTTEPVLVEDSRHAPVLGSTGDKQGPSAKLLLWSPPLSSCIL